MPELPEVETLVRELSRSVVGHTIVGVTITKPKLFDASPGLSIDDLRGRQVQRLRRRAKLSIWELSGDLVLVVHLKLAGQLVHLTADGRELAHGGHPVPMWGAPLPHLSTHVELCLEDGSIVYLTDIRQFARLHLMRSFELRTFLAALRLGPEPLTRRFSARALADKLRGRRIPLKTSIMDQSVVGGIGNIYADESLWLARLHPRRIPSSLTASEVTRLHRAIRIVLGYAIREGVAFVPNGRADSDRAFPYCHGRAGAPCPRCTTTIEKEWVGGRGTHFCPRCQTLPSDA